MRAVEFIKEEKEGAVPSHYKTAAKGVTTFNDDGGSANSDYVQYRVGLAVACADGTTPLDIEGLSWYGKRKTAQPYTELEQKMLDQAYKAAGASHTDFNKGKEFKSRELKSTNTVSPVAQWNKKA